MQNSESGWYLQLTNNIVGPLTEKNVSDYLKAEAADGLTYAWSPSLNEWKQLADIEQLKGFLLNNEESSSPKGSDKTLIRLPLNEIPEEHKYITPEGVGQVFDLLTRSWMKFADYQKLFAISNAAAAEKKATKTDEKNSISIKKDANNNLISSKTSETEAVSNILDKKAKNAESRRLYRQRLAEKKKKGGWLKAKANPNVYVSGLPPDVTEDELHTVFKRAGVIKIDPDTSRPKIKIYRKADGSCSGDAIVSFAKEASVNVATQYLDNSPLRGCECPIRVEQAKFVPDKNRSSTAEIQKDRELERKRILAARLEQRRLLGWNEGISDKRTRILILRPLWTYEEAMYYKTDSEFYIDVAKQVKNSLSEWASIISVTPIPRHPYGIVCIKFHTVEDCEAAVARLNDRNFRHLLLPEREEEIVYQLFQVWEAQNNFQTLYRGTTAELTKPDEFQLDLLQRLNKRLSHDKTSETNLDQKYTTISNHNENSSLFTKRQRVMDKTNEEEFLGTTASQSLLDRRRNLLVFLLEKPLILEAYAYDGKTDLRGQALAEATHAVCDDNKDELVKNKTEATRKRTTDPEAWEKLLEDTGSDDEELIIQEENVEDF